MARKPLCGPLSSPRQAIWQTVRSLRELTVQQVRGELPGTIHPDTIRTYLNNLVQGGYLEIIGHNPRLYRLLRDIGIEAPRVRADGSPVTSGAGHEQLWRTMRILDEFDPQELAIHAGTEAHSISLSEAKSYCRWLHLAGYLYRTGDRRPPESGPRGVVPRYRLRPGRYTGPLPPKVQRLHQVVDLNTGAVVYRQDGDRD